MQIYVKQQMAYIMLQHVKTILKFQNLIITDAVLQLIEVIRYTSDWTYWSSVFFPINENSYFQRPEQYHISMLTIKTGN